MKNLAILAWIFTMGCASGIPVGNIDSRSRDPLEGISAFAGKGCVTYSLGELDSWKYRDMAKKRALEDAISSYQVYFGRSETVNEDFMSRKHSFIVTYRERQIFNTPDVLSKSKPYLSGADPIKYAGTEIDICAEVKIPISEFK